MNTLLVEEAQSLRRSLRDRDEDAVAESFRKRLRGALGALKEAVAASHCAATTQHYAHTLTQMAIIQACLSSVELLRTLRGGDVYDALLQETHDTVEAAQIAPSAHCPPLRKGDDKEARKYLGRLTAFLNAEHDDDECEDLLDLEVDFEDIALAVTRSNAGVALGGSAFLHFMETETDAAARRVAQDAFNTACDGNQETARAIVAQRLRLCAAHDVRDYASLMNEKRCMDFGAAASFVRELASQFRPGFRQHFLDLNCNQNEPWNYCFYRRRDRLKQDSLASIPEPRIIVEKVVRFFCGVLDVELESVQHHDDSILFYLRHAGAEAGLFLHLSDGTGGAWCELVTSYGAPTGRRKSDLVGVFCQITFAPGSEFQSLKTLCHELGHAFEFMLNQPDYAALPFGIGGKHDSLEFCSMLFESFCYHDDFVETVLGTGQGGVTTQALIQADQNHYRELARALEIALFDAAVSLAKTQNAADKRFVISSYAEAVREAGFFEYVEGNRRCFSFHQVFGSQYGSFYYSYLVCLAIGAQLANDHFSGKSRADLPRLFMDTRQKEDFLSTYPLTQIDMRALTQTLLGQNP